MRLTREHRAPTPGHRGPGQRSTPLLALIALVVGLLGLLLGMAGPASAAPAPAPAPSFPVAVGECRHGGWADFTELDFHNQGGCIRWVQTYIVRPHCLEGALADFQETGPTTGG